MKDKLGIKYSWKELDVNQFQSADLAGRIIERDFTIQLLAAGTVIQPIICTQYEGKLYLIDGRRRVLHSQYIARLTPEQIGELVGETDILPDHFKLISAKVFDGLPPTDQSVWSLILNEQRSENLIQLWITVRTLQREGKWDEIAKMHKLNKARFAKFDQLNKLDKPDVWVRAFAEGKITETTMMAISKLGGRQPYVEEVLQTKGKVAMSDVQAAKTVTVAAAIAQRPFNMNMPTSKPVETSDVREFQMFLVYDPIAGQDGGMGSFNHMLARKRELGGNYRLYKLVEV